MLSSGSRNDLCASCRYTICRVRLGMVSDQITRMDVEHGCKLSGEGGGDAFSVGMRNMENYACVVRRSGSRPGQVDTFGCKLCGGGAKDVFR